MYLLKTEQTFDSAHFLSDYQGKCRNLHGHQWRVIVEICGKTLSTDTQTRMASYFYTKMKFHGYTLRRVTVYETPKNCAIYEE